MNDNITVNGKESMGGVIRRLRMERDWTQEELAARLNVSGQAVSKWETGQSLPDVSQVPALARTFGVTTDELFGMEGQVIDFPAFDHQGTDPEKAWETWQAMGEKLEENEGYDGCVWSYVFAGYKLCCPDSPLYHPDHAAEAREETLRYAEGKAKRMEKCATYGHSFRALLMELYALSGKEPKAIELAMKYPPFLANNTLQMATVYRDLGKWEQEANALVSAGSAAAHLLLDIAVLSGEAALKLGQAEDALDAAEFGVALIGLLKGAASPLRDDGDLCQLGARAQMALGDPEKALRWLADMLAEPKQRGAVVRRAFFWGRAGGDPVSPGLRRALMLRSLDHPDLEPLRETPEYRALRERAEALAENAT